MGRSRRKGKGCIKSCLSIDAQTSVADTAAPAQITPSGAGGLEELFKAMKDTLGWKLVGEKSEIQNPNPIKLHLQTYTPDSSLKAAMNTAYPNLALSPRTMPQDHPLCVRLFLFSLSAMLCGQREDYQVDPWGLVATAWSIDDCTRDDLIDVWGFSLCKYFDKYKHEGDIEQAEVEEFLGHCDAAMQWPPETDEFESFSTYLMDAFREVSLLERLFGTSYNPKYPKWDADTRMFLFAMLSLVSSGQNTAHRTWLAKAAAGCGEGAFRKINSDVFKEPFADHIEERRDSPMPIPLEDTNLNDSIEGLVVVEDDSSELDENSPKEETRGLQLDSAIATLCQCLNMAPQARPQKAQNFLHWITHEVLKETNKNDVSSLTFRSQNNMQSRIFNVDYGALPRPSKSLSEVERHAARHRVNRIKRFVQHQAAVEGSEDAKDDEEDLLARVAAEYGLIVLPEKAFKWTDDEIALMRSEVCLSGNQLLKLDRLERHLKGNTRYPAQLGKRIREYESNDVLAIEKEILPLEMNKDGLKRPQLFFRIKAPHRSLERLVETIFLARRFMPSISFCSIDHSLIFAFGCDKDTFQTSMLLRCANRAQGNSSQHVSTLALYEKAAECYENLAATILKKDSSTQTFLQSLADNKLFVLTINTRNMDTGDFIQSECITFDLFADTVTADGVRMLPEVIVKLERRGNSFFSNEEFEIPPASPDGDEASEEAGGYSSEFNKLPKCGILLDDAWRTWSKFISIELVADDSEVGSDDNTFYGFRLYVGSKADDGTTYFDAAPFYSGRFKKPIHREIGKSYIECDFMQAIGFISCDMKNSWLIQGMPESVTVANCIVCTQEKETYKLNFADWMLEYARQNNLDLSVFQAKIENGWTDCPLRCGVNSCTNLHELYCKDTGDGDHFVSDQTDKNIRAKRGCVTKPPLIEIHPMKQTMGPLHNGGGLENHFKDNLDKMFEEIDAEEIEGEVTFKQQVNEVERQCKSFVADKRKLNSLKKKVIRKQKGIESIELNIERAMNPETRLDSVTDEHVQGMMDQLDSMRKCTEIVQYGEEKRLHKGANNLLKAIEKYKSSKKPKGPAQYALRKAIQVEGSKFNAQHGGMDLSHAHGMVMLEKWPNIVELVKRTYESTSKAKHAEKVCELMEKSQGIATPMFEMNKILKSQDKADDEKKLLLKRHCFTYFFNWLELFPWQDVFPKQHSNAWHIITFVKKWEMYGILSEESFESRHQVHKKVATLLAAMPNDDIRIETFNNRIQASQKPEVQETSARYQASLKGKARGSYQRSNKNKNSLTISTTGFECGDNNIIRLDKSSCIKKDWLEVYEMCSIGRVPSSWRNIFSHLEEDQAARTEFSGQT